ncbi:hypothetical protein AAMO2058_000177300 [Amorphochlora amoebiformis]
MKSALFLMLIPSTLARFGKVCGRFQRVTHPPRRPLPLAAREHVRFVHRATLRGGGEDGDEVEERKGRKRGRKDEDSTNPQPKPKRNPNSKPRSSDTGKISSKTRRTGVSAGRERIARDHTQRFPLLQGEIGIKIVSWNVAGLRSILNKPEKLKVLKRLIDEENPDIVCLQETKLQDSHVDKIAEELNREIGMSGFWACSTERKGYSGVATLLKNGYESLGIPSPAHRVVHGPGEGGAEGRIVETTFGPNLRLLNLYVPNSGAGLKRLDYRVNTWDTWLQDNISGDINVVICGDLNVAHKDSDFFCPENKAYETQAGTTPAERESFGRMLKECELIDTFRHLHPKAKGVYSYWSQRARNRDWNRGLRLDYFVVNKKLVEGTHDISVDNAADGSKSTKIRVVDSFVLDSSTLGVSDHAPVGLLLGVKRLD